MTLFVCSKCLKLFKVEVDSSCVEPTETRDHNHSDIIFCSQVVRSLSDWSGGQDRTEYSIMQAMVTAIREAKHYVYIENQFFISYVKNGSVNCDVRNAIATAIYNRILKAHENDETFRVYVLLPLLPAFEGDIAGDTGSGMRAIMFYQYQSIARGENSLIFKLQQAGIKEWNKYIGFYSLRTHDQLKG